MKIPFISPPQIATDQIKLLDGIKQQIWDAMGYGDLIRDADMGKTAALRYEWVDGEGLCVTKVDLFEQSEEPPAS